jgi:basic amino acid/polyamine antiporter, APA family
MGNMGSEAETPQGTPGRTLTLADASAIVVGTIIGAGVFESAPRVAAQTSGAWSLMVIWVMGGLLSLAGALCFAEMAGRFRDQVGGDWAFLRGAFGKRLAFLFAWAAFWIVRPGNIAAMSLTFARYAGAMTGQSCLQAGPGATVCAVTCVLLLTAVNLGGLRTGTSLLRWLTTIKVVGIAAIALAGLAGPAFNPPSSQELDSAVAVESADGETAIPNAAESGRRSWQAGTVAVDWSAFGLALVFVMYAYGGWNDVAFVSAEIRRPEVNVLRSLVLGTLAVTVLYVLLNAAFLRTLGFSGMTGADAVATSTVAARLPA